MPYKKRIRSPYCLNCGKVLQPADNFCPNCGQENDNKRQSFRKVMSDLVQGFLSIDSRLANSLPALLFRPGFLTREYLKGKRQRYLDPVRMFITIIVMYFIISSLGDKPYLIERNTGIIENNKIQNGDSNLVLDEGPFKLKVDETKDAPTRVTNEVELDVPHYIRIRELVNDGITDTRVILDTLNIEPTFLNRFYYGEIIKFARVDFDQFKEFLASKLPWIIFLLMPVFALLLKLLYLRRNFLYIDHLIFAFNLHSFLFLAGIVQLLIIYFTTVDITGWLLAVVVLYILLSFKNFYRQSWRKTILKLILLWMLYLVASLISFILAMVVIFLIY